MNASAYEQVLRKVTCKATSSASVYLATLSGSGQNGAASVDYSYGVQELKGQWQDNKIEDGSRLHGYTNLTIKVKSEGFFSDKKELTLSLVVRPSDKSAFGWSHFMHKSGTEGHETGVDCKITLN